TDLDKKYWLDVVLHDFAETATGNVIDEAADGNCFGNPWMGPKLLQLMLDIFFDVLEGVEECGRNCCRPSAIVDSATQVVLTRVHQSAIRVIDDHEFLGAQEIVRCEQGAQSVVGND